MVLQQTSTQKRRATVFVAVALIIGVFLGWGMFEARWLQVSEAVVYSPNLPAELNGTRVVFAADLHAGTLLGEEHLERTIDTINEQRADLIILGGDYVGGGRDGHEMFYEHAARLEAPMGVLAVLGNHEGRWLAEEVRAEFDEMGITIVENRNVRVRGAGGADFQVGGVEDLYTGAPDVEAAAADIAAEEFAILVSHQPDVFPDGLRQTAGAFDLALAGHMHGGQITAFGLWAPMLPSRYGQRFRGGWLEVEDTPVLITRGTGVYLVPMRFFAPPEINVIELRRGDARVER